MKGHRVKLRPCGNVTKTWSEELKLGTANMHWERVNENMGTKPNLNPSIISDFITLSLIFSPFFPLLFPFLWARSPLPVSRSRFDILVTSGRVGFLGLPFFRVFRFLVSAFYRKTTLKPFFLFITGKSIPRSRK